MVPSCPWCEFCLGVQIVYVGEHREWLCGQGFVLTSWTLCRCRRLELWEAAA